MLVNFPHDEDVPLIYQSEQDKNLEPMCALTKIINVLDFDRRTLV